jgi:hypothetical protein
VSVAERWESGKNLLDEEAFDAVLLALNLPDSVCTALVVLLAKRDVWVISRDALIEPLASSEGPLARKEVVTASVSEMPPHALRRASPSSCPCPMDWVTPS